MNKLYQEMMQNNPTQQPVNQFKQMMNTLRTSKNPQQLFLNMLGNNPQVQQAIQMMKQTGQSPKDLFYQMAQQKGVDPQQIINMLQ